MIPLRNVTQFDDHMATIETRRLLYQLITLLRRSARSTSSTDNKALYDTSAEVVVGLARAFRAAQKAPGESYGENDQER